MWLLNLLRLLRVVVVNLWLSLLVVVTVGQFRYRLPFLSDCVPSIRLRRGGTIRLGRVKARTGLRLFADGGEIRLGDGVFFNNGCSIAARVRVRVGDGCLFGENVCIYDHNHRFSSETGVDPDAFSQAAVSIGDRCWIASGSVVLKGVSIAARTVIGAGSIVRRPIEEAGVYVASGSLRLQRLERSPRP